MVTSAYTKAQKKQIPLAKTPTKAGRARDLEQSLLSLESACMVIMDSQFIHDRDDMDGMVWQRRFKNIVTPVSLALSEYKGPRRFHYHYKHREDDDTVLHPVMEDPLERLAQVCQSALTECQNNFAGLQDSEINDNREMLEQALRKFLLRYKNRGN